MADDDDHDLEFCDCMACENERRARDDARVVQHVAGVLFPNVGHDSSCECAACEGERRARDDRWQRARQQIDDVISKRSAADVLADIERFEAAEEEFRLNITLAQVRGYLAAVGELQFQAYMLYMYARGLKPDGVLMMFSEDGAVVPVTQVELQLMAAKASWGARWLHHTAPSPELW